MGNHHSHEQKGASEQSGSSGTSTPRGLSRRGTTAGVMPHTGSGADIQEKPEKPPPLSMVPVEKLGKFLAQHSQKEDGVNGVTENSFTKYLFPSYEELARQFYRYVHRAGKCKNKHIPLAAFRQQCERIMAMLDDALIIETYVRMFSSETEDGVGHVTPHQLTSLLYTSYKLSMDHYPEGPQTCPEVNTTLSAVVRGCFNNKESHSVGFVVRWLQEHCHRVIFPIHRYCVHVLATRHRDLEAGGAGGGGGLELGTPVLERGEAALCGGDGAGAGGGGGGGALLTVSGGWLVAAAAPALYSLPASPVPPPAPALWLARMVCALPSHWVPLYASRDHGLAVNRFLHHTLAYRGPTIVVLQAGPLLLAVGCPQEWRESVNYWGGPDTLLLQLFPSLCVVRRGPRLLYLNATRRGHARGLRVGPDPRAPLLQLDDQFDHLTYGGDTRPLHAIEVWGCGDAASRDVQLDIKKWQVREAEKQRQVKLSAAEWLEHPDRYLLELGGRPQYNNSGS